VLLLGRDQVDALLDQGRPSLAFFAAWAVQRRHGPKAEQIVERALDITDDLPEGRGLSITRAQRAAIRACEDLARLDRWIAASGKAGSVQELLAETPAPKRNGAQNGAARHRAARAG
jgi:hypothetical protein